MTAISNFSFIILTYNEELYLPRLFRSIEELNAPIYILVSGSSDLTLAICKRYNATLCVQPFENYPKQWKVALESFEILTPWVICLDADHIVTAELFSTLYNFKNENYKDINGIIF